jgi:hypothetical protein
MATLTMPEQTYPSTGPNCSPTGVQRDTQYTITYSRPNELRNRLPPVGRRPIADWADILAAFVAACNADDFAAAYGIAASEYVVARIGVDVPSGKRTAFTTFMGQQAFRGVEAGVILP